MPRLLDLCSGTGSVPRAFDARGWDAISVDIGPKANAAYTCDILDFDWQAIDGHVDVIYHIAAFEVTILYGWRPMHMHMTSGMLRVCAARATAPARAPARHSIQVHAPLGTSSAPTPFCFQRTVPLPEIRSRDTNRPYACAGIAH